MNKDEPVRLMQLRITGKVSKKARGRTGGGTIKVKSMPSVIRRFCADCAGSPLDTTLCTILYCELWPWRTGQTIRENKKSLRTYLAKHLDIEKELEEIMELRA